MRFGGCVSDTYPRRLGQRRVLLVGTSINNSYRILIFGDINTRVGWGGGASSSSESVSTSKVLRSSSVAAFRSRARPATSAATGLPARFSASISAPSSRQSSPGVKVRQSQVSDNTCVSLQREGCHHCSGVAACWVPNCMHALFVGQLLAGWPVGVSTQTQRSMQQSLLTVLRCCLPRASAAFSASIAASTSAMLYSISSACSITCLQNQNVALHIATVGQLYTISIWRCTSPLTASCIPSAATAGS